MKLGPQSLSTDTRSAALTISHLFFLCLTRVLVVWKFQNSKNQNLFALPASWEEQDFFQECSNWSVYSSKHHQNHLCFFTVLNELEKLIIKNKRASKSKLTAVPLSKVKSQTFRNREGSKKARENAFLAWAFFWWGENGCEVGKVAKMKWEWWHDFFSKGIFFRLIFLKVQLSGFGPITWPFMGQIGYSSWLRFNP